jgi:hypothetical protein
MDVALAGERIAEQRNDAKRPRLAGGAGRPRKLAGAGACHRTPGSAAITVPQPRPRLLAPMRRVRCSGPAQLRRPGSSGRDHRADLARPRAGGVHAGHCQACARCAAGG